MAVDPNPLPTDRTRYTLMGPTNHPSDHNRIAERLNELYLWYLNVLEDGGIGTGGEITPEVIEAAVLAGVLTPAAIGAMDESADVVVLENGRLRLFDVGSEATPPPAGSVDYYSFGGVGKAMDSAGAKTQLTPPWVSPFLKLGATADISTEVLVDVLTSPTLPALSEYRIAIDLPYEAASHSGVLGGQLRNAFTVPGGTGVAAANSKGSWHGTGLNAAATGTSGTASANYIRRTWDMSLDLGGRGAGNPCGARIEGTLKVGTTAGVFRWRARRAATDSVVAKIYGDNEPNGFGGASMLMTRVA